MARVLVTLDVPGRAEDVFDYLADFTNTAAWDPGVARAERLDAGPLGVGSRFRVDVALAAGATSTFTYRVAALERPFRFRLEGDNGLVGSDDDVTVTPAGDGVRVTYDARLSLPWWLGPADPLVSLGFSWSAKASVAGMRRALGELATACESAKVSSAEQVLQQASPSEQSNAGSGRVA
jgi:carbon monoxide dehydrogenase subunit G